MPSAVLPGSHPGWDGDPNPQTMSKLHIFDMDGTLLTGSACLDISRHLGQIAAVDEIEARWTVGGGGPCGVL